MIQNYVTLEGWFPLGRAPQWEKVAKIGMIAPHYFTLDLEL
jgi:hypothetical protein